MIIQAYLGLEERFSVLDQKGCEWLQLNFAGAQAEVLREGGFKFIGVEQLTAGDEPRQVSSFPEKLKHLTLVNDKLISALTQQRFKRFEVALSSPEITREQKVTQVNALAAKVKAGVVVREKAVNAIESVMDGLAQGISDLKSLDPLVDSIVENEYADAMGALATLKENNHTYGHCVDVGAIFTGVYEKICLAKGRVSAFRDTKEAFLAGLLHDVGKSMIPKSILESTVSFEKDSPEMKQLRSHPEKSAQLLEELKMPSVMVNMALYHHVKVDGQVYSSYPRKAEQSKVSYEARLLGIIDVYQALIGRRPYKKSWTAPAAMRYLDALAGIEFDEDVLDDFVDIMGLYPLGSFVVLSDGTQGFVMNVPEEPSRPLVAVVKGPQGEKVSPANLIDLATQKDLKITNEIDPVEVFGPGALDEFTALKVS